VDKLWLGVKYLGITALGGWYYNSNAHAARYEGGFREPEGETKI